MKAQIPSKGSNPYRANMDRRNERQLDRACLRVRITSTVGRIPRKRKKYVQRVERGHLRHLIVLVAKDLERKAWVRASTPHYFEESA